MNLLLDTCTFLWISLEPARLSATAARLFADPANPCQLSVASAWEIAVKYALGQITLVQPPGLFVPQQRAVHGILSLPVAEEDACLAASLPTIHKDPFDRMLICQAMRQGLTLLTPDPLIARYPGVKVVW